MTSCEFSHMYDFFDHAGPGSLVARNITLKGLIEVAYDVNDFQVLKGPDWINSDRYDKRSST